MLSTICALLLPINVSGNDSLLEWIPKEAFEAAEKQWALILEIYELDALQQFFGFDTMREAKNCTLKNGYKLVDIRHEDYSADSNLLDHIDTSGKFLSQAYGFGIYTAEGRHAGDIYVYAHEGSWKCLGENGGSNIARSIWQARIFNKYPPSEGYIDIQKYC
jgi:hypothetical protein